MTVVESEVRPLPGSRAALSLALVLQWFHSCHHFIVPPITHNYPWQHQRHPVALTKDTTLCGSLIGEDENVTVTSGNSDEVKEVYRTRGTNLKLQRTP